MNIWALYAPVMTSVVTFITMSVTTFIAKSGFLITDFFFGENDLNSGGLWADLN